MPEDAESTSPQSIRFDLEKSRHFRVIYVQGGVGGITAERMVQIALYNERVPIPKTLEFSVTSDGNIGTELRRETRPGVYREVEVDLVMKPASAFSIGRWLLEHAIQVDDEARHAAVEWFKAVVEQSDGDH